MSLIEVLFFYRDEVRRVGKDQANQNLHDLVDPELHRHIITSVNDKGEFIQATGACFEMS